MDYSSEEKTGFDRFKGGFIELIEFIAIVLAILVVIRFFIAEPHRVSGHSMDPNFNNGDFIITNKISLRFADPQRGEVVILKNPRDLNEDFIKRILGLPGERIKIADGHVYIDDQALAEPYLPKGVITNGESYLQTGIEITVPEGQYFVIGDNRGGSSDSREWGPVKKDLIIGQAWLRYWPPQRLHLIQIDQPSF